ncbi:secreted Ly-6/uPAR domain-containing protein 2 [Mirounga angustirostris]|uniref:secreted Ly-6/uPAR domain-containing protein 2 n=1 Tax=Mirounga angustirostris TaxID=9716 RepID=UPI001E688781|nr:secreted Ly-6/uPAR domain-containing protein 2 [Mirounga angustirostris]
MRLLPGLLLAAALSLELGESRGHLLPHCSKPVPQPQPAPSPALWLLTSGKPNSCPLHPFGPISRALSAVLVPVAYSAYHTLIGFDAGVAHPCVPLCVCVHPPVPPPAAAAGALKCHQCKGFGGCHHAAKCPRGSNYCVSIGTRDPFSVIDLPLVTKSCYSNCPDILSLGLGPNVSIVCCQYNLCNID